MLNCEHEFAPGLDKLTSDSPAPLEARQGREVPRSQPGHDQDAGVLRTRSRSEVHGRASLPASRLPGHARRREDEPPGGPAIRGRRSGTSSPPGARGEGGVRSRGLGSRRNRRPAAPGGRTSPPRPPDLAGSDDSREGQGRGMKHEGRGGPRGRVERGVSLFEPRAAAHPSPMAFLVRQRTSVGQTNNQIPVTQLRTRVDRWISGLPFACLVCCIKLFSQGRIAPDVT